MIINKTYLKQYSPLPTNYDLSEVMLYVPVAQEIWIRPILGDAFMDELEYQVENDSVSSENATLFTEVLYQYLSFATCLEALPFIWSNFSEAGITVADTDYAKSISLKDITYIEQHLRKQVEFLKDRTIKWICERCNSFPLFNPSICNCGDCCGNRQKLNNPNPNFEIYRTKNIDIRLR